MPYEWLNVKWEFKCHANGLRETLSWLSHSDAFWLVTTAFWPTIRTPFLSVWYQIAQRITFRTCTIFLVSVIIFFPFLSIISLLFNKSLFTRKGLIKFQKILFVTMLLLLMLWKYSFIHFLLRAMHLFLCFLYSFSFSLVGLIQNLFLNLILV